MVRHFPKRRYIDDYWAYKKVFIVTGYQRNINQNNKKIASHTSEEVLYQKLKTTSIGGMWRKVNPIYCWECWMAQPLWKTIYISLESQNRVSTGPRVMMFWHTEENIFGRTDSV